MSLWANFALGFTYLSPLVGVYSLLAVALSTGGPPSIWWIVIVACGQLLVSVVFGEVVSQFPIHGGIYPWARRLWGKLLSLTVAALCSNPEDLAAMFVERRWGGVDPTLASRAYQTRGCPAP